MNQNVHDKNHAPQPANASRASVLPIEADRICVKGAEGQTLLSDINLTLEGRGLTVVLGPNGAGKSLLLRALTGLVRPSAGQLTWAGNASLGQRVKAISFVFQKPVLFRRTVLQNIVFVLSHAGVPRDALEQEAVERLKQADLSHLADAPARRLSGGEQQRVAIARALATQPDILFLDEPTAHLDPASTQAIEAMIIAARDRGTRIVHVTHDLSQARRLAGDVVFIHRGKIVEAAPATQFFETPTSSQAQAFVAGDLVI